MTTTIHTCPACSLRFTFVSEMIDHVRTDHHAADEPGPTTWGQVTVPVDPADDATTAVQVAAAIARQANMSVALVAAPGAGIDAVSTEAFLRRQVEVATDAGAPACAWHLLPGGDVAEAVLDVAQDGDTTLLCMATHSRGPIAEAMLGSVSETVMRHSSVPVVLLGPHVTSPTEDYTHLLVGVDGSAVAQSAVDVAAGLAPRLGADITLVQVIDPGLRLPADVAEDVELRRAARRLPASRTAWDVLHDVQPGRAIVAAAASLPNPLVVVGTHGRSGIRRAVVGSVALDVVRDSATPVIVIGTRPEAAAAGDEARGLKN